MALSDGKKIAVFSVAALIIVGVLVVFPMVLVSMVKQQLAEPNGYQVSTYESLERVLGVSHSEAEALTVDSVEGVLSRIQGDVSLSADEKVDAAHNLGYVVYTNADRLDSLGELEPVAVSYVDKIRNDASVSAYGLDTAPVELLSGVYRGVFVQKFYGLGSVEDNVGLDYEQIMKSLYRGDSSRVAVNTEHILREFESSDS